MAWQQAFPCEFVGLERKEEKGEGRKGVFANTVSFEINPFYRNFNLQNGEKLNAEPSTDHCRICRHYNLKINWERCLSQKNLLPRPKGFSPMSVLPGILGRPEGLLTQIQFALTSFSFLLHATWVDCLSFPLRVVILLKMWALEFQFLLRVSSLKGPYYCRSISRRLPFGETSASQV